MSQNFEDKFVKVIERERECPEYTQKTPKSLAACTFPEDSLILWIWANYLTFLGLSFLSYKVSITTPTSQVVGRSEFIIMQLAVFPHRNLSIKKNILLVFLLILLLLLHFNDQALNGPDINLQ